MRRCVLTFALLLTALPLWASYGLSNVGAGKINREPVIEQVQAEPEQRPEQSPVSMEADQAAAVRYPYTIHLSSWQDPGEACRALEKLGSRLDMLFITKIDLGASGIWHRVDHGLFPTIKDAVARLRELKSGGVIDRGAFVGGQVGLAIDMGAYGSMEEAQDEVRELGEHGIVPYVVREADTLYRLLVGAYPDEDSASPALRDLGSLGYRPVIRKR